MCSTEVKGTQMREVEDSHFKIMADKVKPDSTLKEERGWHKMDVRWLVTGKNTDSKQTVVGRTIMPPGVKSRHAIHRHPNAEEWEYIVSGVARKQVGNDTFVLRAGELAFIPRNVYHGLENASDTEPLVTLWGYCGASSLEEAGYIIPEDGMD
jgi:quercetin dioxygenase-like cupin family protein